MFGTSEVIKKLEELQEENDRLKANEKEIKKELSTLRSDLEKEKAVLLKAMELEHKEKMVAYKEKVQEEYNKKHLASMEENFTKLKDSLGKLHEEGNANTKYLEKVSLKMMDALGNTRRSEELDYDRSSGL